MKHKQILILVAFIVGLSSVGLLLGVMTHQAIATPAAYAWHQVGGNGLGDPGNYQIPSLVVFGDYLYAGTWNTNWITTTAQIWRTSTGVNWSKVDDRRVNGTATLTVFNGVLYAGSWDGNIWSSLDGLSWTSVITDGFGTRGQGIARMMIFGAYLYASTWNGDQGTEVWRTSNGNGWEQFIDEGLHHNPNNASVIASEVFNGYLYMGVVNDATGAQLWRTNGITTTDIITDGFGDSDNLAISSLALYQDMLYAGTYNEEGVQVWRSGDGDDWQKINFGFGNPHSSQVNALEVFEGQLYLAVADYTSGMQVWRTSNGLNWEQVASGGFGDSANHELYWDNGMVVFKDRLFVGVTNWQNAGEIWQYGESFSFYLPFVKK